MTTSVTLTLPCGGRRTYSVGDRVRILFGCPDLPDGCTGMITAIVDERWIVVQPDGDGQVLNPISSESMYLEPSGSSRAV